MKNREFFGIGSCTAVAAAALGLSLTASGFAGSCGSCDAGGVCDLQVGINGGFIQDCGDGQWVSVAFPFPGGFGDIDTVTSTHLTNTDQGSIYITGGTCAGPDVNDILATMCCAIENDGTGAPVDHCFPTVSTDGVDTVWVVMTFHTGFSFDVMYNSGTVGTTGSAYGNLDGGADPGLWADLNDFGFGACYCVSLSNTGCEAPVYECEGGGGGGCDGADGDCCVEGGNGTPGCDDLDCCEIVCGADPFCCDTSWDGLCADQAQDLCDLCAGGGPDCPGEGDCCEANGSIGCDDLDCCETVCAADAFCCETEWDQLCADQAADLCGELCGGDPPCEESCDGDINGDGMVDGADLGILLGAWDTDDPCANLSGDGNVDGNDLGILLGAWGPCPLECGSPGTGSCEEANGTPFCDDAACCNAVCDQDPFCCESEWDEICAMEAFGEDGLCLPGEFGPCNGGGATVCDLQVGVNGGFVQECEDGQWVSVAFPIQTNGATVDTVSSVHLTNTGLGSIYVTGGTCAGPDVTDILATLCCAIEGEPSGEKVNHCFPAVATSSTDPTWIVMTFHTGFSFDVMYDSSTINTAEVSYGNLDGGSDPSLWGDLADFNFGAQYCVDLLNTGCTPPVYECPDTPDVCPGDGDCFIDNGTPGCDDVDCCEAVCAVDPFCCDVAWDGICADQAVDICGGGGDCPQNDQCGITGSGDCLDPDGTGSPGCEDNDCCNCVCQLDPFCCDVEWDSLCAGEAAEEPACGGGGGSCGTGDCCVANGSPGCDDDVCCESVCGADAFCCDVEWDGICADAAAADPNCDCGGGGETPVNDECDGALVINLGDTSFSTIGATDSGPELPAECDEGFGLPLVQDIWYSYTPATSGTLVVSTCDSADYDTRLAAYSDCGGTFVACNDDGDGCGGFTSIMNVPVAAGQKVFIRIGGFGTSGTGVVNLSQ